jgi:hypothetical protein
MTDVRFPVGRFAAPAVGAYDNLPEWRADIAALPEALRTAVAGLDEAALDTPYRDGGWTVRQVVHHLADSHLNAYTRCKLALTEDHPTIRPYDQAAWANLADGRLLALGPSLSILDGIHARWTMLIDSLGDAELARSYVHPEHQKSWTLGQTVAMYAWHGNHHTAHIRALRDRQGW